MYWLYKWIDDNRITRAAHARQVLSDSRLKYSLRAYAENAEPLPPVASGNLDGPLLAGEGLDPAGPTSCYHPACADARIRGIALRVALYFDSVVLDDPFILPVLHNWEMFRHEVKEGRFEAFIELLLHFRAIGAEPFLSFTPKPHLTNTKLQELTETLGLGSSNEELNALFHHVSQECQVKLEETKAHGYTLVTVDHPDIATRMAWQYVSPSGGLSTETIRISTIQQFIITMLGYLSADIAASRSTGATLGMTSTIHQRVLSNPPIQNSADVAFQLNLPVLDGVPANEFLAIRGEHEDEFRRFKTSVRRAMKQRLNADGDNTKIAAEIQEDIIEPEIQRISTRLAAAESVLRKKTAVGVGVGAITTTCGLVLGLGATAVAAGIASMLGITASAAVNNIDKIADVKQSDVYYLWRLAKNR